MVCGQKLEKNYYMLALMAGVVDKKRCHQQSVLDQRLINEFVKIVIRYRAANVYLANKRLSAVLPLISD